LRGVPEDLVEEIGEGEKGGCGGKRGWINSMVTNQLHLFKEIIAKMQNI
jgi:hypothetical protein